MFWLVQLLVPICVCVVLPVIIVWIIFRSVTNKDNKNAEIIIKAIESNSAIDADKLVEALSKKQKNAQTNPCRPAVDRLHIQLHRSCKCHIRHLYSVHPARHQHPEHSVSRSQLYLCNRHSVSHRMLCHPQGSQGRLRKVIGSHD